MATLSVIIERYRDEAKEERHPSYDHFMPPSSEKLVGASTRHFYRTYFVKPDVHPVSTLSKRWTAPLYLQDCLVKGRARSHDIKQASIQPRYFSVPESVTAFLQESRLPVQTLSLLDSLAEDIDGFLNEIHIDHHFKLSLFTDSEETDWRLLRFTIAGRTDLQSIYRDVRPRAYEFARQRLDGIADKVIMTFERFD